MTEDQQEKHATINYKQTNITSTTSFLFSDFKLAKAASYNIARHYRI